MSEGTSFSVKAKFKEILRLNGIHDPVSEIAVRDSDFAGQNFGSQTQLVTITFESPFKKPLNLFVKVMTDNEAHLKMTRDGKLFVKESTFFMKYLPAAREFCRKLGQENAIAPIFPKCYFGDEQMVVLENLVLDRQCVMIPRGEFHDFETATLAMTSIAKHHAVSRAYIKHVGGPEVFFKRFPTLDFESFEAQWAKEMFNEMLENCVRRDVEILRKTDIPGKEETLKYFQSIAGKAYQSFMSTFSITAEDKKLLVLNHGDFHSNNMMFRKDEQGRTTDNVLIDLQITRYGSPCLDLHCYLALSMHPSVRRERVYELLKVYLDVFKKTSEDLGHPSNITFDELECNYHQKRMFGFWYNVIMENGLVFKLIKNMAPDQMPELSSKIDIYLMKFLEENPDERIEHAKELLNLFKEFNPYG